MQKHGPAKPDSPHSAVPPELTAPERALLAAATELGGELRVAGLAQKLRGVLASVPGFHTGGLGVHEEERGLFRVYMTEHLPSARAGRRPDDAAAFTGMEMPAEKSEIPHFQNPSVAILRLDLTRQSSTALHATMRAGGAHDYVSVPLRLQDRLLGTVFAGFLADTPPGSDAQAFLKQLARIVAPLLWNCFTHERFTRGDRRRDTLLELSHSINTSLKLGTVLEAARRVIARLADNGGSAIYLLDETGETFSSYHGAPPTPTTLEAPEEPQIQPTAAHVMAWIREHGQTYQSGDLDSQRRFEDDDKLRTQGVRRYVATPLKARGRILGALLIGSTDPHPALKIDLWLYENIALQLALAIDNARQHEQVQKLSERLRAENVYLREEIQSEHDFGEMVGRSAAMRRLAGEIARVAPTDAIVLIAGETGVGKELVARAIHAAGPRAGKPMVKVNCAAIPEGTVESELFGHERGAFTSAIERRIGRFELAHDGTLFLDEVGELPLAVQSKLLRVLQDGEFERVGGAKTLTSNARVIAATNRNLFNAVETGQFRRDLYYRLNVFPIQVAPLRERREDIPPLVEAFIQQFNRRMGKRVEAIDRASLDDLCRREWPGNVRELKHVIERAMILCDDSCLRIEGLPTDAARVVVKSSQSPVSAFPSLQDLEADHIRRALMQTGGVIEGPRGAARILGLNPSTLRFRMKRLGIPRR